MHTKYIIANNYLILRNFKKGLCFAMDKNIDFNNFVPPYTNSDFGVDFSPNDAGMFNPINQYEQAYMYYRYMCMFMDYKIKCKKKKKMCIRNDISSKMNDK